MKGVAIFALIAAIPAPGDAQTREPEYEQARNAGQVGEQQDGYLGMVGNQSASISKLVGSINIRRKALYTQKSAEEGASIVEFAFITGCNLILKTVPGEKYELPGGGWATRTAAAPTRDPRCV